MSLQISVHFTFSDAQPAWDRCSREGSGYVFQTYAWLSNWFDLIGEAQRLRPCIVAVETADGEPLMLLPLAIRSQTLRRTLVFMGGRMSDYHAPLLGHGWQAHADNIDFGELWARILASLPGHDVVALEKLPQTIGAHNNPFATLANSPHPARAHYAVLGDDAGAFMRRMRSARSLSTDRRKERRLSERGTLSFELARDPARIESVLATMVEQKSRSYAEMGVSNIFAEPGCLAFVRRMTVDHPEMIALFCLCLDGEPLATLWGLYHDKRYYHLFPTYARNAHTALSPGNVLLTRVFGWCVDNDIGIYDFTVGDEGYKGHWCDHDLALFDIDKAVTLRGSLFALARRSRTGIKRMIKSSPGLFAAAQYVRRLTGRIRGD